MCECTCASECMCECVRDPLTLSETPSGHTGFAEDDLSKDLSKKYQL